MSAIVKHVTIVGLGLIGGSVGMAIRRRRLAGDVVGFSRNPATARRAKTLGAIDRGAATIREAVREAELVVLAAPADCIVELGREAASCMRPGGVLTDVGSTKAQIVRRLEAALRANTVSFVGGHPLAGSEQRGIDAARAELFDGSTCLLTKTARTSARALAIVRRFWRSLGCRVVTMTPPRHDALLAATSHLPHLLAWSLVSSLPRDAHDAAPPSLLDMTRIADSDPELWDDIVLSNRRALLAAVDRFEGELRRLRSLIARGRSAALRRRLAIARARRHALDTRSLDTRNRGLAPPLAPLFRQMTIVGLELIGGSVGMAIRARLEGDGDETCQIAL